MSCPSLSAHFCGHALIGCRSENAVKGAILNFFFKYIHIKAKL